MLTDPKLLSKNCVSAAENQKLKSLDCRKNAKFQSCAPQDRADNMLSGVHYFLDGVFISVNLLVHGGLLWSTDDVDCADFFCHREK